MKILALLTGMIAGSLVACTDGDDRSGDRAPATSRGENPMASLSAWHRVGDNPWKLTSDGVAAGPAEATGFLVSPDSYGNFRLTLDYRIEDDTNSGVYLRCTSASDISPATCYEVNIWDNHPKPASRTGSIVQFVKPADRFDGLDRWVEVEVVARDDLIVVSFDGAETARLKDTRSLAGPIALQYAGTGELSFRNVRIERL